MNNELVNVLNDLDEIKTDKSAQNIMQIPSFFPEQFKYDTGITNMVTHLNLLNNMNNTNKELVKIVSDALFNAFKTAGFIKEDN